MSGDKRERSHWGDFDWQLIRGEFFTPMQHIALDKVLLDEVGAGRRSPTLRIWDWKTTAIVIGIFQSLKNEVDADAARELGVEVVRRVTGGGAMFMEPEACITYSIYAPESLVAGMSFQESYAFMDDWVMQALGKLGIRAWYKPLNDITSDGGKIGGAAQARRGGAVLHHVTMAYDMDASKMLQVLRIGREKLSDKGTTSAAKRVDPLRSQTGLPREAIIDCMVDTFGEYHGVSDSDLSPAERETAEELIVERFGTEAWRTKVA